jgi:hypothetical protein
MMHVYRCMNCRHKVWLWAIVALAATISRGEEPVAFDGPQKGKRLERIPSLTTQWGHWMMLHPESTAYDLFDGRKLRRRSDWGAEI